MLGGESGKARRRGNIPGAEEAVEDDLDAPRKKNEGSRTVTPGIQGVRCGPGRLPFRLPFAMWFSQELTTINPRRRAPIFTFIFGSLTRGLLGCDFLRLNDETRHAAVDHGYQRVVQGQEAPILHLDFYRFDVTKGFCQGLT